MSGAEVIGLISAIISIVEATIQVGNAIKDEAGLPPNFKASATKLPLITKLLDDAERYVEGSNEESITSTFNPILTDCEEKAKQLQQLFDKVVPAEGDSRMQCYLKAARTIGKGGRVETLMAGLLDSVQLMATKFPNTFTRRGQESLTKAIDEVAEMEPSLPNDFDTKSSFVQHGNGVQNNNFGNDNSNISGSQNHGSGTMFIGHNIVVNHPTEEKIQTSLADLMLDLSLWDSNFNITFSMSEVPRVRSFVAREKEIEEMHQSLSSGTGRRVVVLQGLGGIGKTQIAATYIERFQQDFSAIFWLNMNDEVSIQQSFARMAGRILSQHSTRGGISALNRQESNNDVIEAVKGWLSLAHNTRWLLVCDNYDNPNFSNITKHGININHYLPTAFQGSIIITTRTSFVNVGHQIPIRKLESIDDSLMILAANSHRHHLHDDIDAKCLVEKLDGLPLAIALAGRYLERSSMSFADYLQFYETSWASLQANTPSLGSYADRTLCTTWQISYEHVQQHNSLAAHLLRWWAFFHREDLWFELVQHAASEGPEWARDLANRLHFDAAMGKLYDYGFVEAHPSSNDVGESRGYTIHGCLHSWISHVLHDKEEKDISTLAFTCIASHIPTSDVDKYWVHQRRLMSHAIACSYSIQDDGKDLSWAFHQMGNLFIGQGKMAEAEKMYLRALAGYEKAWGPDHTSTLNTVNNLGLLYADQGKMAEAEKMYLQALAGYEKAWGPDHTSTLDTVYNLGILYADQGKMVDAEKMYLQALAGKEQAWGPDHTSTLNTVHNLGNLYADQGKIDDAEKMYLRALTGYEKASGPDHTSTLDTVHNLGILYADQGKMVDAEKMYLRALAGYEKAIGQYDIATYRPAINTILNMGILRHEQGMLLDAKEHYQRAYDRLSALLGPDHPDSCSALKRLVEVDDAITSTSVDNVAFSSIN